MASGDALCMWTPMASETPASNYATIDSRNNHVVADFDDTTNETLYLKGVLPPHYDGGGLTAKLHYAMSSATSGDTDWDVAVERIGAGQQDIDSDGFAAAQSADNNTVPATSGHVAVVSIPFTAGAQMDSLAAGEAFRLAITRDAASDTASGDAELVAVELLET